VSVPRGLGLEVSGAFSRAQRCLPLPWHWPVHLLIFLRQVSEGDVSLLSLCRRGLSAHMYRDYAFWKQLVKGPTLVTSSSSIRQERKEKHDLYLSVLPPSYLSDFPNGLNRKVACMNKSSATFRWCVVVRLSPKMASLVHLSLSDRIVAA